MIIQHLSYDNLDSAKTEKWLWYILFTTSVGILLLLNWLGIFKTVFGVDTAILLTLIGGYKIFYKSITALVEKRLSADLAILIAIAAALAIGEYVAAAEAVFIMLVGEGLEEFASRRTHSAIEKLIAFAPRTARIMSADGEREVHVDEVQLADIVIVRPGERIPVDGEITSGHSSINEAPITGEPMPVEKQTGDSVFAGSFNAAGAIEVRVTRIGNDTTLARIISLVEEASRRKAPAVRLADRYASFFLPILLIVAAAVWYFTGEWIRTVAVLLVACPCALILATPAAVVAAIGRLARDGILVKSGAALEAIANIDTVVFDKTGTITTGKPMIAATVSFGSHSENELLQLASIAEQRSEHVIARLIVDETRSRGLTIPDAEEFTIEPGLGVAARQHNRRVIVGNRRLIEAQGVSIDASVESSLATLEADGASPVIVVENGIVQGVIAVRDLMRPESAQAIHQLRHAGIQRIVLLTGDRNRVAESIGREAGVDEVHADLLPEQKVEAISRLQRAGHRVAMIGDGINDAPALAMADAGIAMGVTGTDIAIEEADVVLTNDRLDRLPLLVEVSRASFSVIKQNIWVFALALNVISVLAASMGILGPVGAAATHQVSALLVVLNSLRLLAYGTFDKSAIGQSSRVVGDEARHRLAHLNHWLRHRLEGLSLARVTHQTQHWLEHHWRTAIKYGVAAAAFIYLISGITTIGPDETAVVRRFGRNTGEKLTPGLSFRLPWPIEEVTKLKPAQVQVAEIGFRTASSSSVSTEPAAYEWNLQHRSGRYEKRSEESLMLTGDENLVEVNAVIQYAVGAPDDFLFATSEPATLIRVAAESALRQLIGKEGLDRVLTSGRVEIERLAQEQVQARLNEYRTGLRVIAVQLQDVHPSIEVVDAFRAVSSAFEEKNTLINQAEAYRNEQVELARGQGLARLSEATGYTVSRANRATGDADRFIQAEQAFRGASGVTETRLYLEGMEQVLAGRKKIIVDASRFGRRQMLFVDQKGVVVYPGTTEEK